MRFMDSIFPSRQWKERQAKGWSSGPQRTTDRSKRNSVSGIWGKGAKDLPVWRNGWLLSLAGKVGPGKGGVKRVAKRGSWRRR